MRFKILRLGIFLLALSLLMAGCGSKGALYLPKEEPAAADAANIEPETEEDEESKR